MGVQALSGLVSMISGIRSSKQQAAAADKIEANNPRPVYKRPKEYGTALDITEQLAYSPNFAGRGYMEEQVGAGTANSIRAINEMGLGGAESAALMSNIFSQEQEGRQQIAAQGAEQQNQGIMQLLQMLGLGGEYSDREFDYNKAQPYEEGAAAASALRGASMANKDNAMRSGLNTATSLGYGLMTSGLGKSTNTTGVSVNNVMDRYLNTKNGGALSRTMGQQDRRRGGLLAEDIDSESPFTMQSRQLGIDKNQLLGLSNLLQFFQ